jgi:phosphate ABC transporter, permease protein PstC
MTSQSTPVGPDPIRGELVRRRNLSLGDPILKWAVLALSVIALASIALMLLDTIQHSARLLQTTSIWDFVTGTRWAPSAVVYGALPFIYGTLITSSIALVIAVPLALGAALLINEYLPGRIASPLAYAIELLAAIPSVVYGFWGILVIVPLLRPLQDFIAATPAGALPMFAGPQPGPSYFAAAVVLAIMILPIVTAVARDAIAATPQLQREAALALGATDWETIRNVVLPFARGGIFAGIILGLSRAVGETIAVLFVIGNQPQINASIFAPGYTLPSVVAGEFAEANQPFHSEALIALGIVLFVISFAVNVLARVVVGRFERRSGGADVR